MGVIFFIYIVIQDANNTLGLFDCFMCEACFGLSAFTKVYRFRNKVYIVTKSICGTAGISCILKNQNSVFYQNSIFFWGLHRRNIVTGDIQSLRWTECKTYSKTMIMNPQRFRLYQPRHDSWTSSSKKTHFNGLWHFRCFMIWYAQ